MRQGVRYAPALNPALALNLALALALNLALALALIGPVLRAVRE